LNQQLREKTASLETAKGELEAFSHSVLHDLQAPLRSLDSFTGLLRDRFQTEMSQVGQSYLQGIVEATGRMQKILAGLQTLARLAKARMEISETDLTATAKNVLAELQRSAPERNAVVDIEDGLKASADSRLIQIAFENLLGNAWKFTSKTPNARIEMGASTEGDERVYWVRDNGAGFDEAQLAKLFVPFKRLHSQQEFPGTGIGLATVKRIIQRHQGRVWAESEPGKGATFYFTLGNPDRPIGGS
jgi:light-regulated signal transduction histidine kinase (bacteriophytochrome)